MKKQNKKNRLPLWRRIFGSNRRIVVSAVITAVVLMGLYVVVGALLGTYADYDQMRKQAQMEPIRTLVIEATENVGYAAPVDAKTGDVYFPAAKLFLPAKLDEDGGTPAYRYRWDAAEKQLTITSVALVHQKETRLYNAFDLDDMFKAVPFMQACSRGVLFVASGQTMEDGWELRGSIQPAGGQRWDMYTDTACPENNQVATKLLNLRAY